MKNKREKNGYKQALERSENPLQLQMDSNFPVISSD